MQLKKVTALSSPSPALRGTMKNLKVLSELAQLQEQLAADGVGSWSQLALGMLPSWSQLALGMLAWSQGPVLRWAQLGTPAWYPWPSLCPPTGPTLVIHTGSGRLSAAPKEMGSKREGLTGAVLPPTRQQPSCTSSRLGLFSQRVLWPLADPWTNVH